MKGFEWEGSMVKFELKKIILATMWRMGCSGPSSESRAPS